MSLYGKKDSRGVYTFPTPKNPLTTVQHNNRYVGIDFDALYRNGEPYEHVEYPKAIAVEMPMKDGLPDEDLLPDELHRKVTEWTDDKGQLCASHEVLKYWLNRVKRVWPEYWPIANSAREEAEIRERYKLIPSKPQKVSA